MDILTSLNKNTHPKPHYIQHMIWIPILILLITIPYLASSFSYKYTEYIIFPLKYLCKMPRATVTNYHKQIFMYSFTILAIRSPKTKCQWIYSLYALWGRIFSSFWWWFLLISVAWFANTSLQLLSLSSPCILPVSYKNMSDICQATQHDLILTWLHL